MKYNMSQICCYCCISAGFEISGDLVLFIENELQSVLTITQQGTAAFIQLLNCKANKFTYAPEAN